MYYSRCYFKAIRTLKCEYSFILGTALLPEVWSYSKLRTLPYADFKDCCLLWTQSLLVRMSWAQMCQGHTGDLLGRPGDRKMNNFYPLKFLLFFSLTKKHFWQILCTNMTCRWDYKFCCVWWFKQSTRCLLTSSETISLTGSFHITFTPLF